MDDDVRRALDQLASALAAAEIGFELGGSGMLYARGLPVSVHDLDITVPGAPVAEVQVALRRWWQSLEIPLETRGPLGRGPAGVLHTEWLAGLDIDGVRVDVTGPFLVSRSDGSVRLVDWESGPAYPVGTEVVLLAAPPPWWAVYSAVDPAKASLLAPLVDVVDRERLRRLIGSDHLVTP